MAVKFNPFTGQLQIDEKGSGGGSSYIDGEVATYNDLPLDGTAALDSAWLVRSASGVWPVSRKQAGIYIRTATGGSSRDADFTYAGTMPDVFSDAVLTIYDEASTTRTGQFNLGSITAGQNRVLTWPDGNGTIARTSDIPSTFDASAITSGVLDNARINFASPPAIGGTSAAAGSFTTLSASTSLTLGTSGILSGGTNIIEQRNTTSAQTFRIYNTVSGAADANFERGFMRWSSNVLQIGTEKGGTGSARNVQLQRDGTTFLTVESSSAQAFNSWVFFGTVFANGGITMTGSGNPLVISGSNNIVEQRNGANSQTFRLFNTHTSSTSFECLNIAAQSAGSFIIGTEKGSVGGTARGLELRTDNTARLTFGASGTITLNTTLAADAQNISTDTTTGTKIGTGTTQKIGFFNATPVVQQAAVADATDAASTQARLNDLLARLRTLGLIAT